MDAPPSLPPLGARAAASVVRDAWLMRHIASFQHGLPLALFDFWCAHDPTIGSAAQEDRNLIHGRHGELLALLVARGGAVKLLDMLKAVRFSDYDHRGFCWAAPQLDGVLREAVTHGRVDVLEWAVSNAIASDQGADHMWTEALKSSDVCVLLKLFKIAAEKELAVVRSKGFLRAALAATLRNGHLSAVRALFDSKPELFGPDSLLPLLLFGAFETYRAHAGKYPEEASRVVEDAIVAAGKEMQLPTIRFIINELGHDDLAHRAMDGAVQTCNIRWIQVVFAVTRPGSCRLSAVYNAVAAKGNRGENRWDHIPFVVSACSEEGAQGHANATDEELFPYDEMHDELECWEDFEDEAQVSSLHPFLHDRRTPSWAIQLLFDERYTEDCSFSRCPAPFSWAVRAIYRRSLPLLHVLHDIPLSAVEALPRVYYDEDYHYESFKFDGARAAAVRIGDLEILEWLLKNVSLPIEATLLDEAVYYHQFEIAEWLLANYPAACTELDWTNKGNETGFCEFGLCDGLLDWLESHDVVRKALPFTGIIDFAAQKNDVDCLRRLYGWYPELFTPRPSLIELADLEECRDTINFLLEIGWTADVFFEGS